MSQMYDDVTRVLGRSRARTERERNRQEIRAENVAIIGVLRESMIEILDTVDRLLGPGCDDSIWLDHAHADLSKVGEKIDIAAGRIAANAAAAIASERAYEAANAAERAT